jgi:presenilin-like A22 family membrane protease
MRNGTLNGEFAAGFITAVVLIVGIKLWSHAVAWFSGNPQPEAFIEFVHRPVFSVYDIVIVLMVLLIFASVILYMKCAAAMTEQTLIEHIPPWRRRLSDKAVAGATTAAIMLTIQIAALSTIAWSDPGAEHTRSSIGLPLLLVPVIVAEALLLVAGYRLYKRLSETWQRRVRHGLIVLGWLLAAQLAYAVAGAHGVGLLAGAIPLAWVAKRLSVDWLIHNFIAVWVAFIGAVLIGTIFGPLPLAGLLVALLIWDRIAVTNTNIMETIVEVAAASGLPAYIMLARSPRLDTDDVEDSLVNGDEAPDALVGVIGTGDFVFPSALAVSLAIAGSVRSLPVVGALTGAVGAAWLLWHIKSDGASPGLPALNGGALLGACVGLALQGMVG